MSLTDVVKPSRIRFKDTYLISDALGDSVPEGEAIDCVVPDLNLGEKVVLNAWGSWEVHHYDDYRRRLGIYQVVEKRDATPSGFTSREYTLEKLQEFSEADLVHRALMGDIAGIVQLTNGLKYIALKRDGGPFKRGTDSCSPVEGPIPQKV